MFWGVYFEVGFGNEVGNGKGNIEIWDIEYDGGKVFFFVLINSWVFWS